MQPREIWSGGQTGVDRAGWDAARAVGIPINGWVPRGRLAEDGQVPAGYGKLMQTTTADYLERTTANVRDSDATLILFRGELTGGTAFTHDEAIRLGKPVLAVDLASHDPDVLVGQIREWLAALEAQRLNVAGPRESKCPGIHDEAAGVLRIVLEEAIA